MNKIKTGLYTILRKSEVVFKTDMLYLIKGGSWLGLNQVATTLSAFLLSLAFANLLPIETYGTYKYVLSIVSLLLISTLTGIDSAVTQAVARGYDATLLKGVQTKSLWGVYGTVASLCVALYYYSQGNSQLTICFLISAVFIPFIESFDLYNSLLNGKKLFKEFSQWSAAKKILATIALGATVFSTQNIFIIITIYFLSTLILNAYFLKLTFTRFVSNDAIDPDAMLFGKQLSVLHVFSTILGELDKILVFHYLGAIDLALYTVATAPTDQIKGLLKNLNSLAFPKFADQDTESIKKGIGRKILILTLSVSAIVLVYILLAPYFFKIFFPKYIGSIVYSQVLAITVIGAIVSTFIYTALEAHKDKQGLSIYNIGTNVFNLILLLPLIHFFGIWGAILARGITRFSSVIVAYVLVQKMK